MNRHLTIEEIDRYVEHELDGREETEAAQHLATCAACLAQSTREQRIDAALRTLPCEQPAHDLAGRLSAAVEWQAAQLQARRNRMPVIAIATFFSLFVFAWFVLEMVMAFQDGGVLDFFALFANHPELFSLYSWDAVFALLEALPTPEIVLTLFSLLTVAVLAQQLLDTLWPRPIAAK